MKLNRRRALAALAGGVAAGPHAALAAFDTRPPLPPSYPPGRATQSVGEIQAGNNIADRVAQAARIARGDIRPEDRTYAVNSNPNHLLSLKSIADAPRQLLQNLKWEREAEARLIANAKAALAEYDKTGILRYFF